MNPHNVVNGDDEQFTLLLARYSEELTAGGDADPSADAALSLGLRQRLQRALDCLRRLRQFRTLPDLREFFPSAAESTTVVLPASVTVQEGVAGGQVGRFRILRTLGHGGGGIVFLAFDPELRREVALKVPRLEALLTPELRRRFLREARVAAGLNHPNLVPVYEAGEANGLCFIVSAYCPGSSLAEWLIRRNAPAPIRLAVELTAVLADAVQYIHERGIYHRDIKPSNILLDSVAAGRLGEGRFLPRLTDFGLAKMQDSQTDATRSGAMMGTAPYMAPEQVEGRLDDIGPRTDVYGLGAVLYELLTRRPPFRGITDADTLRQVLANEPSPPRRLNRDVPADLETICLKCLEKEPAQRYAGAAELAGDLRRFLAHEPVRARPPGRLARLGKWMRRRPASAVLLATGLLITLALLSVGIWLDALRRGHEAELAAAAKQTEQRQEQLRKHDRRLRQYRYADVIVRTGRNWEKRHLEDMGRPLERHCTPLSQDDPDDPRGFEWYYLSRLARPLRCRIQSPTGLFCAAFFPDGTTYATGHQDGTIRLWDPATGKPRRILTGHKLPVCALAYSPDGKHLVSGGGVTTAEGRNEGELFLWDTATLQLRHVFPAPLSEVHSLALSPDGRSLAAALWGNTVKVWAMPSGTLQATIPFTAGTLSVAFSSNSATITVGLTEGRMSVCAAASGHVVATWQGHQRDIRSVAYSHTNAFLVSGGIDQIVQLWERPGGRLMGEYRHAREVWSVAVSPDDRSVASLSRDGIVKLWDVENHRERFWFAVPPDWGQTVTFSPDGKTLAVGNYDGKLWMYEVSLLRDTPSWLAHWEGTEPREAWSVAFSPNGKTLASAGDDHAVRLWDPATGKERAVLRGHQSLVSCLAYSPDGKRLATGSFDEQVKLWDAATGEEIATLHGHTKPVYALAFAPDGKLLATAGRDCVVRLWDVAARKEQQTIEGNNIHALAFSPDGRALALTSNMQAAFVWDIAEERVRLTLPSHPHGVVAVAFSPDGKTLVTGDTEGTVHFWDAVTGDLRVRVRSHTGPVNCLAFTPDGRTLASASFDRTVKLWQTSTGRELLTLSGHADRVRWVTFSGDGRRLAVAGHDGILKIYRAAAADELTWAAP